MKTLDNLKEELKSNNIHAVEKRIIDALRVGEESAVISKEFFTEGVRSEVVRSGYVISKDDGSFITIDLTKTDYPF